MTMTWLFPVSFLVLVCQKKRLYHFWLIWTRLHPGFACFCLIPELWLKQMLTTLQWSWTLQWKMPPSTSLKIYVLKKRLHVKISLFIHHHQRAPTLSYVFLNYLPPLMASEVWLRREAHTVVWTMLEDWGTSLSQISKAALPVLDTKQAGRFKKGHGEPRTSIDMLIAATKG